MLIEFEDQDGVPLFLVADQIRGFQRASSHTDEWPRTVIWTDLNGFAPTIKATLEEVRDKWEKALGGTSKRNPQC